MTIMMMMMMWPLHADNPQADLPDSTFRAAKRNYGSQDFINETDCGVKQRKVTARGLGKFCWQFRR